MKDNHAPLLFYSYLILVIADQFLHSFALHSDLAGLVYLTCLLFVGYAKFRVWFAITVMVCQ